VDDETMLDLYSVAFVFFFVYGADEKEETIKIKG